MIFAHVEDDLCATGWMAMGGKQVGFWLDAMTIHTVLTNTLKLRVPLVMGGMQWVGKPALAAAVSNAGALGMLTALTQPTPEALRAAIEETRSLIDPQIAKERSQYGAFGVNITLLPAIVPPDYEGYARAALEAGVRIFETAGSNPEPVIKVLKQSGAFVIHFFSWRTRGLGPTRRLTGMGTPLAVPGPGIYVCIESYAGSSNFLPWITLVK